VFVTHKTTLSMLITQSKVWVCSHSLARSAGLNPAEGHGCLSLVTVLCCRVQVPAMGQSLIQKGPTKCGVSTRV
jgi:hypothetical protein